MQSRAQTLKHLRAEVDLRPQHDPAALLCDGAQGKSESFERLSELTDYAWQKEKQDQQHTQRSDDQR
jgi:hypothetical protein